QVSGASLDVLLFSKEGLANTGTSRDRCQCEAKFDSGSAGSVIPAILIKEMASQTAGESELRRIGLANSYPIKGADHRVQKVRHQQPFKLVLAVSGCHQIETVEIRGTQEL